APDGHATGVKQNVEKSKGFDGLGVAATLNQIKGMDHAGHGKPGVPTVFGMTFVTVSVAQKLNGGGYLDADGTPSPGVKEALSFVDASIGQMVQVLKAAGLSHSTPTLTSPTPA